MRAFRSDQLVEQDRPAHHSMRSAVHEYFTPQAMESWRPFVRTAVAELLDEAAPQGRMDVLEALAAPLPVRVITQMMGVPEEDREHLRHLADRLLYINRGEPNRMKHLMEGIEGMIEYVAPKVDERAATPSDDFISVLAAAEKEGVFTRHQVLVNTALLLFAGHETTMNLICNGTLALIRHPDQWERLRADPRGRGAVGHRGVPPVRPAREVDAAHRRAGRRAPRKDDPQGRPDPLDHGRRQPRPPRVRGARPLRHRTEAEHARLLRRGDPLLPRRLARPHRGPGGLPRADRAVRVAPAGNGGARVRAECPVPLADRPAGGLGLMPRELRITVDHDLCMGNGQCVFLAPEVFRHNENRQSEVVDPDGAPEERVLQAASYCPTGAIAVADAATDETLFP